MDDLELSFSKDIDEVVLTYTPKLKGIKSKMISNLWYIKGDQAKGVIDITAQLKRHNTKTTLSRNFSTNDRMLWYKRIQSTFYTCVTCVFLVNHIHCCDFILFAIKSLFSFAHVNLTFSIHSFWVIGFCFHCFCHLCIGSSIYNECYRGFCAVLYHYHIQIGDIHMLKSLLILIFQMLKHDDHHMLYLFSLHQYLWNGEAKCMDGKYQFYLI